MPEPVRDRWAQWLLERRHGGDAEQQQRNLPFLQNVRNRVLEHAELDEGDILLDVGAGDGLIAFGALEWVGESGAVIFSDISQDLLDHSRKLAEELDVTERCSFLRASADDLSELEDGSVDVVTTRSVLIYVEDKRRAFEEFHRVLKPGGRVSIFEPINSFKMHETRRRFLGYDVEPVRELAEKVWAVYERHQPPDTDPMLNFDERDLFNLAAAGFDEVRLTYEASVKTGSPFNEEPIPWDTLLKTSGNPKQPPFGEAMEEALDPDERKLFTDHLRPLVEAGEQRWPVAVAHLKATKSEEENS
ncbi:MAG: methyltransferase domain-containing protein [Rubrobacteraceae bacterium]